MEKNEKKIIESIYSDYQEKELTKLDELKNLDKKVKRPARTFAYIFGSISSLVLGIGMCAAMKQLPEMFINNIDSTLLMVLGIVIGLIGMGLCASNYFIYKRLLKSRRNKYSKEIISLSEELLNK